jgi:pimeloyl-ACP methyl ester carboxylesterase
MGKTLTNIAAVAPKHGVNQWVKCTSTGMHENGSMETHTFGAPHLMPGTTIFVHGVNSEGEWYGDAANHFARGLNARLGRHDIQGLGEAGVEKRHARSNAESGRALSPIIPFYWGYSAHKTECLKDCTKNVEGTTDVWTDVYGNPLRQDRSWGGGPFANGTTTLQEFWGNGFNPIYLKGLLNLNILNPMLGRDLMTCPERLYYVHAARRLANLVKTIRNDFPDEPINIVGHSQGTMIALCSMFYLDGIRGPDTILLNSSPFRIDTRLFDPASVAAGLRVENEQCRSLTFRNAADIMAESARSFKPNPHIVAEYGHEHNAKHAYDDAVYVRHDPVAEGWEPMIGSSDKLPMPWWKILMHSRNNRGKIFVNFNPGDRVIGASVVAGIGWRGLGLEYMDKDKLTLGTNVFQRMFSRNTNVNNPPPGSQVNYVVRYYFSNLERLTNSQGERDANVDIVSSPTQWQYFNSNTEAREFRFPSELILKQLPILGNMRPTVNQPLSDGVYINAPSVPNPPTLDEEFDGALLRFDGQSNDLQGTRVNKEAIDDFEDVAIYSPHKRIPDSLPGEVERKDDHGRTIMRYETHKEVESRLRDSIGGRLVSPTNHAAILRYISDAEACPVEHVLTYDLTVGPGYAWGDPDYWEYLLNLADWKCSDPYYLSGTLDDSEKSFPKGITTDMRIAEGERLSDYSDFRAQGYV